MKVLSFLGTVANPSNFHNINQALLKALHWIGLAENYRPDINFHLAGTYFAYFCIIANAYLIIMNLQLPAAALEQRCISYAAEQTREEGLHSGHQAEDNSVINFYGFALAPMLLFDQLNSNCSCSIFTKWKLQSK